MSLHSYSTLLKIFLCTLLIVGCKQDPPPPSSQPSVPVKTTDAPKTENTQKSDNQKSSDERLTWQKPFTVINAIGDISDKVVVDLGSGIGYFTFKMIPKCEKVIAVDIDKDKLKILDGFKSTLSPEQQDKLEIRVASETDPNLKPQEADVILIVNTIAYLQPRVNYLSNLKKYLKPGGEIFIVDYKSKRVPSFVPAPPFDERLYIHILEEQLEQAGYNNIVTDDTTLDYQYMVSAKI